MENPDWVDKILELKEESKDENNEDEQENIGGK